MNIQIEHKDGYRHIVTEGHISHDEIMAIFDQSPDQLLVVKSSEDPIPLKFTDRLRHLDSIKLPKFRKISVKGFACYIPKSWSVCKELDAFDSFAEDLALSLITKYGITTDVELTYLMKVYTRKRAITYGLITSAADLEKFTTDISERYLAIKHKLKLDGTDTVDAFGYIAIDKEYMRLCVAMGLSDKEAKLLHSAGIGAATTTAGARHLTGAIPMLMVYFIKTYQRFWDSHSTANVTLPDGTSMDVVIHHHTFSGSIIDTLKKHRLNFNIQDHKAEWLEKAKDTLLKTILDKRAYTDPVLGDDTDECQYVSNNLELYKASQDLKNCCWGYHDSLCRKETNTQLYRINHPDYKAGLLLEITKVCDDKFHIRQLKGYKNQTPSDEVRKWAWGLVEAKLKANLGCDTTLSQRVGLSQYFEGDFGALMDEPAARVATHPYLDIDQYNL